VIERTSLTDLTDSGDHNSLADETLLVDQARQGDTGAFLRLVGIYDRRIFRVARYFTESDESAEGVLQGTFLQAYDRLGRIEGELNFRTLVIQIAVGQVSLRQNQKVLQKTPHLNDAIERVECGGADEVYLWDEILERLSTKELEKVLESAIRNLDLTSRKVFLLRDIENLSLEEASRIVGLSISAFKSSLLRARLRLRDHLARLLRQSAKNLWGPKNNERVDFAVPHSS
jgi:RNA polymerase sigma-70 factor (ECF subfamily)